jgi:hydrogenase-4 component F
MYFGANPRADTPLPALPPRRHISLWCLAPMWMALVPLLILGLWWPEVISHYFSIIADQLSAVQGTRSSALLAGGAR